MARERMSDDGERWVGEQGLEERWVWRSAVAGAMSEVSAGFRIDREGERGRGS